MQIILPSDVFPPRSGGAGWSAHALALALVSRGHIVQVIVPREGGPPRSSRELDGLPVVEVGYRALRIPILRNYLRHERLWPRLAIAIRESVEHRPQIADTRHQTAGTRYQTPDTRHQTPDTRSQTVEAVSLSTRVTGPGATLIHAQHVQSVPAAVLAARRLSLPVVATVRDHWPWDYFATGLHGDCLPYPEQTWASLATDLPVRLGPLPGALALPSLPYLLAHRRRRAAALATCDAVVAVSSYIARRLAGIVAPERLHVIPNMVDLEATNRTIAQPSSLAPTEPFLLFVGKLEHNKGAQLLPAILAAAQAALPTSHPALHRLVLAGNGPLRSTLERDLARLRMHATFLDWAPHDEVLRLMARCTALLFPSSWGEPLSRVLLEASACGTAILALPTGGTTDIITDGVSGALEPTPEALGRRLAHLLPHEISLRAYAAGARRQAEQRFAAPIVVRQFEQLYASLI